MTVATRTAPITGLTPNTTYHARMVASDAAGTTYGPDITFTTPPMAPTVQTGAASGVSSNGATLNGTVDDNYGPISDAHFEWGATTAYGNTVPLPSFNPGPAAAAAAAANISVAPSTTYHFRLVATNAGGTTYGADQSFTTLAVAPTVTTAPATAVSTNGATLNGTVDASGSTLTDCHFEWGPSTAYGNSTPCS